MTATASGEPSGELSLDRRGAQWRGTLPGLGLVLVGPTGTVAVEPEGPDPTGQKAAALTHGWGELLASTRRGHALVLGAAVVSPDESASALLVCGTAHEVAPVVLALAGHGWLLLSDRPSPASWENDQLVAHPRSAPLVMAFERVVESGLPFTTVRTPSNAVAVDVPRAMEPSPVRGLLLVQRRRPHEEHFTELSGHRKFERAASIVAKGVLAPESGSEDSAVSEHLRLAELPSAVIRVDSAEAGSLDALLAWWAR
ncbi:MAG: hypothetical protein PSX37_13335 [bacterium]|nr:hypothetical protein [bacterium]